MRIEYVSVGDYRISAYSWRKGVLLECDLSAIKGCVIILLCGHGVVTKPDDTQIVARVKLDTDTFVWHTLFGSTSFVRRERLPILINALATRNIVAVRMFCIDAAVGIETVVCTLKEQFYDDLCWRQLLFPTSENSALAQTFVRRLAPLVLGVFFVLLIFNAMISPRLNRQKQTLRVELSMREHTELVDASTRVQQCNLFKEFSAQPTFHRAIICDQITRAVPDKVILTQLGIEPPTKRFEAQKPFMRQERSVFINGTASCTRDILLFVTRLTKIDCCKQVQLTQVETQRDIDRMVFQIEFYL